MSTNGNDKVKEVTEQLSTAHIKDLREVSFADQHLKLDTEKEASTVVAAIEDAGSDLECLCLEGNTLGQHAAKAIGKALEKCPALKRALWKDLFTGRLKTEIPEALRFLSAGLMLSGCQLVELDLSDNALGPIGAQALVVVLSCKVCWSLKILKLNNNGLGPAGSQMLFGALSKALKDSKKDTTHPALALKTLVCGRNRLENVGATALGEFLKELGTLEELWLPQNGIFQEGTAALARGLAYNKNLRLLNLNDNILTPAGAGNLAKALRELDHLEVLNLGDCLLKTAGARALANVLKQGHSCLREVYLGYNEITLLGGLAVVQALGYKEPLEVLELDGNRFGAHGVEQLEAAMDAAGKLDKLCAFSDDEGSSAAEEEEEVEGGEGEEGKEVGDTSPATTPLEASAFLAAPTAAKLVQMGHCRAQNLVEHVHKENPNEEEAYLDAFLQVASVVGNEEAGGQVREMALACADALLAAAFEESAAASRLPSLTNALLVRLGLIKDECKKSTNGAAEGPGALLLLSDLVKQQYFAPLARDALQLLLSRPSRRTKTPKESRACSDLLRILYQA